MVQWQHEYGVVMMMVYSPEPEVVGWYSRLVYTNNLGSLDAPLAPATTFGFGRNRSMSTSTDPGRSSRSRRPKLAPN